jgi:uncharacterized membrane protein
MRSRRGFPIPLLLLVLASCQGGQDPGTRGGEPLQSEGQSPEDRWPGGTAVFSCLDAEGGDLSFTGTDFNMAPGELALWLPLRFGRPYDVLGQAEGAHGARYLGDGVLLTLSGDGATLTVDEQTFEGCRLDRRRSVWEHAKLTGVDFRATGNEPGWHLEIRSDLEVRAGKRIRFVYDYGERDAILHAPDPEPGDSRTVYYGESGDLRIVVEIEARPCQDSMSGEGFESTVTVRFQGETYLGCGRALH